LGNVVNLIYRSSEDFDFDSYLQSYKVDTLLPDSLPTENKY
jgi:hypothetical protein